MLRFRVTIFISAFLLFLVQPILGRTFLPWFGGGPAVWSVCLLFFQVLLLMGYAWAYFLDSRLPVTWQARIHLGLLLICLASMMALWTTWPSPITPSVSHMPTDSSWPAWHLLILLGMSAFLPFLVLSSTSPLLQAWFRRSWPGHSPYPLYSLSNTGSLLALLAYPFAIEPAAGTLGAAQGWVVLFLPCCIGIALCAWAVRGRGGPPAATAPAETAELAGPAPGAGRMALWFALSATGSALLLSTTNQMCQEVAVVPFLWVLPLALYLLTFILSFARHAIYRRAWFIPAFLTSLTACVAALFLEYGLPATWQIVCYASCLFFGCLCLHGELANAKPHPAHLTRFYLIQSAGGASGGAMVSLLAPALFAGYWELNLSLLAAFGLIAVLSWRTITELRPRLMRAGLKAGFAAFGGALLAALVYQPIAYQEQVIHHNRNFFGVLRVVEKITPLSKLPERRLYHGQILHGFQQQAPGLDLAPTAYFGVSSGLGTVLLNHPRRSQADWSKRNLRLGVLGLGVGTTAAYGAPGDVFRFYEIDPAVIALARGQGGYFSYLKNSLARIEMVEGDARVSLERERSTHSVPPFDVLVLDVFSSDAIPVHLLTVEAFRLYLARLKPDGLLLLHITNLNLDLEPVVDRLAGHLGLTAATIQDEGDPAIGLPSTWMLVARNPDILGVPAIASRARPPRQLDPPVPLWTDDHTSLLPVIK